MSKDERESLAEDRTDLAEDRTLLANERTFAGWLRTGFASIGVGLGFHVLFKMIEPLWVPKAIGTAFLLIGIFIFIAAERRAAAVNKRLNAHQVETFKKMNLQVITIVVVLATIGLIAAIWIVVE